MVKTIKQSGGKVLLNFKDEADREKAARLIEEKKSTEKSIESIYVPTITYPVLVKLANINGSVHSVVNMGDSTSRIQTETILHDKIKMENSKWSDQLVSLRVLHSKLNPSTNAIFYLVRLCTSTAKARDDLINSGKILLENLSHRVSLPDAAKEIRRCLHCQKYGHSSKFCTAKSPRCGHCAGDHQMADCTSLSNPPCCAICKSAHEAGHHSCAHQQAAVKAYKHRMILP